MIRAGIDARKIGDFGIGTYIRGLIGGIAEQGGVELVAFAPAGAPVPAGVEHVVVDAPHYSIRELFAVGRAADRAGLDLFHAPHYVVPFTRVPVVTTIHDLIHLHQPLRNPLAPLYARAMIGRALRRSVRILTVTNAVRGELIDGFSVDPGRIAVTANGIDQTFFTPRAAATGRYFLYAGNDKPHKNVGLLVDAFEQIRGEEALVLAGAPFERFARRRGVVTAGFVPAEALAALYRGAIALVMPSSEEGFGLPAAEAMACGAPVITSSTAALVEVTNDAALHFPAGDAAALAEVMRRVRDDGALRESMSSRGVARARELTWRRCAELTVAAYDEALRASRK